MTSPCMSDPDYYRKHDAIKRHRGKAKEQGCTDCSKQARDWSQIHGTDGWDPEDYEPRCRSCHFRYDMTPERAAAPKMHGCRHSEEARAKMRASRKLPPEKEQPGAKLTWTEVREIRRLWDTGDFLQRELGLKFNVARKTIGSIVRCETWREDMNQNGPTGPRSAPVG